jgi:hypothetical protein
VSPPPAPRLTRRTTLGGALAGVALLTGCDIGSEDPSSGPAPPVGPGDPDTGLVETVADDIAATWQLVESLRRRHDSLRRPLSGVARIHEANLQALGSDARPGRKPAPGGNARQALARLKARELRHQRLLADQAVAAQSGRLARLLASMSAAVAQQLAELPEPEEGR